MSDQQMSADELDSAYEKLKTDADAAGYHLNPDLDLTKELVQGLLINERRYGYWACPCRLASGDRDDELDIICPCDYRDPDLGDHDTCYCSLYVSEDVMSGTKEAGPIPERRPPPEERAQAKEAGQPVTGTLAALPYPVWRCRVCGYLCARDGPPGVCPVCKAKKDRFERFL